MNRMVNIPYRIWENVSISSSMELFIINTGAADSMQRYKVRSKVKKEKKNGRGRQIGFTLTLISLNVKNTYTFAYKIIAMDLCTKCS